MQQLWVSLCMEKSDHEDMSSFKIMQRTRSSLLKIQEWIIPKVAKNEYLKGLQCLMRYQSLRVGRYNESHESMGES